MERLIIGILCYAIGSVPTAYLLVKRAHGIDVRHAGSGNVGAMNSYDTTGKRSLAAKIALIDIVKGMAAMLVARTSGSTAGVAIGMIALIAGHDFSPWIGFRGGRGLAPATGASFLIAFWIVPVWGVIWVAMYKLRKDITVANYAALIGLGIVVAFAPEAWWGTVSHFSGWNGVSGMIVMLPAITMITLVHRRGPMKKKDA